MGIVVAEASTIPSETVVAGASTVSEDLGRVVGNTSHFLSLGLRGAWPLTSGWELGKEDDTSIKERGVAAPWLSTVTAEPCKSTVVLKHWEA